jgi:hypothetical protein
MVTSMDLRSDISSNISAEKINTILDNLEVLTFEGRLSWYLHPTDDKYSVFWTATLDSVSVHTTKVFREYTVRFGAQGLDVNSSNISWVLSIKDCLNNTILHLVVSEDFGSTGGFEGLYATISKKLEAEIPLRTEQFLTYLEKKVTRTG